MLHILPVLTLAAAPVRFWVIENIPAGRAECRRGGEKRWAREKWSQGSPLGRARLGAASPCPARDPRPGTAGAQRAAAFCPSWVHGCCPPRWDPGRPRALGCGINPPEELGYRPPCPKLHLAHEESPPVDCSQRSCKGCLETFLTAKQSFSAGNAPPKI